MKKWKQISTTVLIMMACMSGPLVIGLSLTGCNAVPERIAFNTLSSVAVSVDSAMSSFKIAVDAGVVSVETQQKIRDLHGRYQPVLHAAVVAAKFDYNTMAPAEVAALAADLTTAIIIATRKGQ